jgi:DNA-binding NarL/FixJ family response regulator
MNNKKNYSRRDFTGSIRILIRDDDLMLSHLIITALSDQTDLAVLGVCKNLSELMAGMAHWRPDMVLLNRRMEGGKALEEVPTIKRSYPHVKILVFNLASEASEILACLEAGADAYLFGDRPIPDLMQTIRSLYRGQWRWPPEMIREVVNGFGQSVPRRLHQQAAVRMRLTPRECQILELMARGLTNKEIAQQLSIEPATVKKHVYNLLGKLGVHKRTQAVSLALKLGWV